MQPYRKQCSEREREMVEQSLISGHMLEKQYMYRQIMWQMFVDFGKTSVAMGFTKEFVFSKELIPNRMRKELRAEWEWDGNVSEVFSAETGLGESDALSPLSFGTALERAARALQDEAGGIHVYQNRTRVPGFAVDFNTLRDSRDVTAKCCCIPSRVGYRQYRDL